MTSLLMIMEIQSPRKRRNVSLFSRMLLSKKVKIFSVLTLIMMNSTSTTKMTMRKSRATRTNMKMKIKNIKQRKFNAKRLRRSQFSIFTNLVNSKEATSPIETMKSERPTFLSECSCAMFQSQAYQKAQTNLKTRQNGFSNMLSKDHQLQKILLRTIHERLPPRLEKSRKPWISSGINIWKFLSLHSIAKNTSSQI